MYMYITKMSNIGAHISISIQYETTKTGSHILFLISGQHLGSCNFEFGVQILC